MPAPMDEPTADERRREQKREQYRRWQRANPERHRERLRRWREANPERRKELARREQDRVRATVFDHYGWSCTCCASTARPTIDHINGDGRQHRAELGDKGGVTFYRWLIKNGFPEGFQTLCRPCNTSKRDGLHCRLDHSPAQVYEPA